MSAETQRRVRNKWRGQGNAERVGIGKSRRNGSDNLGKGTEMVNEVLRLCRGLGTAQSFFESEDSLASLPLAWTAQALALEVDDKDFGQSFVEWLGPPQNMHKLLSKWRCLSCGGQLSIFDKLVSDGCRVSRGGLRFVGLLVFVELVVLVAVLLPEA